MHILINFTLKKGEIITERLGEHLHIIKQKYLNHHERDKGRELMPFLHHAKSWSTRSRLSLRTQELFP